MEVATAARGQQRMKEFNVFGPEEIFKGTAASKAAAKTEAADAILSASAMLAAAGFDKVKQKLLIAAILKLTYSEGVAEWLEDMIE